MRKIFQHIRRQPKQVRDNYAFGFAASFTLTVLLIWLVARPESAGILAQDKDPSAKKQTPFASLIKETKERFATLKEQGGSTQTAAVNEASTTASGIVLSQEDITIAQDSLEKSTTTDFLPENRNYQEVLIATTSDAKITQNNEFSSSSTATTTLE